MITPTNWIPLITLASTTVRAAWSNIPIFYPVNTTTVQMGDKSIWEDAWMGRMPKMRLWSGPRVYQEPAPQTYTAVPQPFEATYTLNKYRYDDDSFGVFYPLLLDLAEQTKKWPDYQRRDLIESAGAWSSTASQAGLDGLSFFNTAHPINIYSTQALSLATGTSYCNDFTAGGVSINGATVGGAFSYTALLTLIEYMSTIRAEDGERLQITPTHLEHPSSLRGEVEAALRNTLAANSVGYASWGALQTQVGATENVVARMGIMPLENKDLASFTKWYLQDNSKAVKSMRWLLRMAPQTSRRASRRRGSARVRLQRVHVGRGGSRGSDLVSELAHGAERSVMGPGGTAYVTPTQLLQYLPAAALGLATMAEQTQSCLDATEEVQTSSYLRGRYGNGSGQPFIIEAWGNDVVRHTAYIAIYLLMAGPIGFAAQAGSDDNIKTNYYKAVGWPDRPGSGWFPGIQRQQIHPDITPQVAIGSNPNADVPQVFSNVQRGWTSRNGRGVGNI